MTKSIIEKQVEFKKAQSTFVEFGTTYLKNWTKQELSRYKTEPVVIPSGDHGFFVGMYTIKRLAPNCWRVMLDDTKIVHDFINKTASILYCLLTVSHRYKQAMEVLEVDTKLGKLDNDVCHYEHSMSVARRNKDEFKSDILLNKYIDAKMKRKVYQDILKKTINSAKYIKFGNQTL